MTIMPKNIVENINLKLIYLLMNPMVELRKLQSVFHGTPPNRRPMNVDGIGLRAIFLLVLGALCAKRREEKKNLIGEGKRMRMDCRRSPWTTPRWATRAATGRTLGNCLLAVHGLVVASLHIWYLAKVWRTL